MLVDRKVDREKDLVVDCSHDDVLIKEVQPIISTEDEVRTLV